MSNNLKRQTSPYLIQHKDNPVDWYPWCDEAFEKAQKEDKPIFLSIGYSTCHWCHVMAHESFEDENTAKILNKNFISIKVDREERPDIDNVYMTVCQAFTGSGGWPTSIFMTSDKKPFFAGTYYPPHSKYGMPSFTDILNVISAQWHDNRDKLIASSEEIINHIQNSASKKSNQVNDNLPQKAADEFKSIFDHQFGGFGRAPKFPSPHNLMFLSLFSKIANDTESFDMVKKTLYQMRLGGIFDHIGYGFSRYSTDKYFLAPHFEKMLYDNALLIIAYASAFEISKKQIYLDTCEKIAEYIMREMTSENGGFYSAQDADSEGVEGKFYTFRYDEIIDILGNETGERFAEAFDITKQGNFEGTNILNLLKSENLSNLFEEEKIKLYEYRKARMELHLDDKILTSWNALMITAFCMIYRISKKPIYLNAAKKSQEFIEKNLLDNNNLYSSFRQSSISEKGFLDDYAFYITALIELYNSTLEKSYIEKGENLFEEVQKRFLDLENGGYFLSEKNQNELFMNPKETYDGAIPSGNSVMAYNLARLYQLIDNEKYSDAFKVQSEFISTQANAYPAGYCMYLFSQLIYENPPRKIKVVLKHDDDVNNIKLELPLLANVRITTESGDDDKLINDKTTFYVCENGKCNLPTNELGSEGV